MISPAVPTATTGGTQRYGVDVAKLQDGISVSGTSISGTLKKIASYPGFGGPEAMQEGHYLALDIEVPEGATVMTIVEGGTNHDYVDCTDDEYCVYRIARTDQKIKIKTQKDGKEVEETYDLTGLKLLDTFIGEDAIDKNKTDYGRYGKTTDFYGDDLSVKWSGIKATVEGTLKFASGGELLPTKANYYPFALVSDYKGKSITVDNGGKVKSVNDTDWVCTITEATKQKGLTVKCGDLLIAEYDFSKVTLASS